ncbi:MAG: FAD-binding oxidoreductase [Chloroflexota bacterium]
MLDRTGLAAGLETAGVAWRELSDEERHDYAVDGVAPGAICWPSSGQEAARALAVAARLGIAVSPRGAGTKVGLGNPPRACELIVSTERLASLVEYAPANLTVTAEAGMSLARLQATLAEGGQFLPLDPSRADRATLGGIIAANASGPRRFGLGSARDLVIGTSVATTSGTVTRAGGRVVKNVAGYDLNKLYIGSLGTLVLVGEITFKVQPKPVAQATVIGRFARADQLGSAVQATVRSPLWPIAVDLLNAESASALESADLPDARGGYLLATLGTAPGRALARQRDDLRRIYEAAGGCDLATLADADSERFWSRVSELDAGAVGSGLYSAKLAAPLGRVPDLIRAIEERRAAFGGRPAIRGRAGSGVLYLSWDAPDGAAMNGQLASTVAGLRELREVCRALGGSLVVEECPRPVKDQLDVWGEVGPALAIMRRLKAALDPRAVMNPGRFVGGI